MSDPAQQFIEFLRSHNDQDWAAIVANLTPDVHEVDRNALRVWFAFYPVKLFHMLAEDEARARRDCLLNGRYRLSEHLHTSHRFFYGHRFWPQAQKAVWTDLKTPPRTTLENHIRQAARRTGADSSLTLAITAVAYATLQQVGLEVFRQPAPRTAASPVEPDAVVAERRRPEPRSLWDMLLRSDINQIYTIRFDENDPAAAFRALHGQPLTMAAAQMPNAASFKEKDARCVTGPIPVECQTGACGTCWIGILSGAENLNAITPFEVSRLEKIGYPYDGTQHPLIRLGCKAVCEGRVSLTIPPWNGVLANWEKPPIRGQAAAD
ncbi:MAG: hypothetical protein SNJ67_00490 [Chloracidobacterium sp.]|uniref:2Fe-2S ferredoxin-type domain-containing protein n=1 Tax=Chloracidobacterium validum TaxID=2821543 RepID=A0ABX8B8B9_9BACT|nr:hypothetical protein [Chloracidobacterium validum]QUW02911.1 hypothetical protein J8C06_00205 [Chloracidobacterium validum]